MDKILEALVCSSHPVNLKTAIVKKVVEAAEKEVTEEQCQALFTLTARFILLGEDAFRKKVGLQVLEAYARCHRPQFEHFFTKDFVLGLLQQGYGQLDRKDPAIVDYIHCSLRLLISCPSAAEILGVVQVEVLRIVCERPEPALCARLSAMLSDLVQCIPEDKSAVLFCRQLVRTIGCFSCPASQEEELKEYVGQVTTVGTLLQNIWKAETATLLPSLQEVFAVISSTDSDFDPSIALASLVQQIPLQMITVLVDSLTTDQRVKDASFTQALCRMIDWLSWPLARHVDTWVIALLKGLAAEQKFKVLIDVTLFKLELVFSRLSYPIVRQGALVVLSHMLLSFQHSPEAFHLVVPHVIPLVQALRTDGLPTSKAFLLQFTELVHCMMYKYSGFPELYDHILETIKDLPKPSEQKIKLVLNQSAWTSQSHSIAPGLLWLAGRSETGKTGLVNLGNTCYMNSIIQTLFMATDFRRRVLSLHLNGANILMKKLQLLFAFLAHTQRAAYAPRNFVEASRPPWFNAGSQQDCSEYLRFLLDRLHEEEKTLQVLESARPKVMSCSNSKDSGTNLNLVDTKPTADRRTLIETMFRGRLSTGIRCMKCDSVSEKNEPFTDLSLAFCPSAATTSQGGPQTEGPSEEPKGLCHVAIKGGSEAPEQDTAAKSQADGVHFAPVTNKPPLSVPDMVNYFLAPEILDAENAYFCETCGSLQRAEKAMRLVAAPEYLILTLLRFSYDAKSNVRRKILDNVTIPPMMRLPVHTPPPPPRTSPSSTSSSSPPPPLQVDPPESSENLAKKLKPSRKDEEEDENSAEERVERAELMSRGGGGGVTVHSVPYVLSSVVMHSGISSESGHYYSYGRNVNGADGTQHPEEDESGNGQGDLSTCSAPSATSKQTGEAILASRGAQEARDWLLFNDSRVTFTNFQLVQNVTDRFPKDTAYVLLYRKQGALGQSANGGEPANGVTLSSSEPPLQKELLDAITKDNKLDLQVQLNTAEEEQEGGGGGGGGGKGGKEVRGGHR